MLAVAEGRLDQVELKWDPRPALCVVATSKGYPGKYRDRPADHRHRRRRRDARREGLPRRHEARRTTRSSPTAAACWRVTALGNTIADAQTRAYEAMEQIHFDGMHYRRDIGRPGGAGGGG